MDKHIETMDAIGTALRQATSVVVMTHVGPDGDAVGSMTAVGQVLRKMKKQVTLAVDEGMPERFGYLSLSHHVLPELNYGKADFDLLVAVDCGDEGRMGECFKRLMPKPTIINIDHHITNTMFGEQNLVPHDVASTCEVLFDLFTHLSIKITPSIAESLLTGIVTDTLCFRTPNTTPKTLQIASSLIEAGAELSPIVMRAMVLKDYAGMKLMRDGLQTMRLEMGVAWTSVSKKTRQQGDYELSGSAGLASLMGNIDEASCGASLLELDDGRVSVSMRSRAPFDVSKVAVELGGGGHAQAAGCTLNGSLARAEFEVIRRLKAMVVETKARRKSNW
ncbi:MAG: DHH family phosphoesterase [Candidatus Promineifilaceae bacterium]